MADIIIPGTNKVLLDGTVVILSGFDDVKYILHDGFYTYNSEMFEGWYGVSIPEQNVIPLALQMLIGCEVVYYPDSNCKCRFPSGNIPFTTEDEYQVQRSFITVDTMTDRDKLSPNMSITDVPNGRIVRVNKPNNLDFEPKYYVYRHNQDLTGAYWEEYNIYIMPADGIPKSNLSDDVQASLDKADTALQELPVVVIDWLNLMPASDGYDPQEVAHNIQLLQSIYDVPQTDYILYIAYNGVLYNASIVKLSGAHKYHIVATLYSEQTEQINRLNIYANDNVESYQQTLDYTVNQAEFNPDDPVIPATQMATADYIDAVTDPKGAAQTVQNNLDIVSNTVSVLSGDVSQIKSNISDINAVIPTQASAQNQLADKDFVNSTVATETAHFIGTFDSLADLESYSGTVTNNDYALVVEYDPVEPEQVVAYNRYKWDSRDQRWKFEYRLNNSGFTAKQWAAINSGITEGLVTSVREHIANATIHVTAENKTAWNSKYAKPPAGIPSSDMTDEVQASLQKAETALQTIPTASAETLGCVRVGENLTIDPQTGIMSAEAGVTTYVLHWFDEPTQEQKDANQEILLQIKELVVAGNSNFNAELWFGTSNYNDRLSLSGYKFVPVVPPDYMGIQLYFDAPTFGASYHGDEYVSYNFGTYYTLSVVDFPGSLGRQYSQSKYVADTQFHSATRDYKGMVQIGDGIDVDQNGLISLSAATANTLGGVKIGNGIDVDANGVISTEDNVVVYVLRYNSITSEQIASMVADCEAGKSIVVYVEDTHTAMKYIANVRMFMRLGVVQDVLILAMDYYHTQTSGVYSYDEIPFYYRIYCSKVNNAWTIQQRTGYYASSSINDSDLDRPSQYAIVDKRAIINYVAAKAYTLPPASASTLGGIKIGSNLSIDQNGVVSADNTTYTPGSGIDITDNKISVKSNTFVEQTQYSSDLSNIARDIQTIDSTASGAATTANNAATTANGAATAISQHAGDTAIHVTSTEKNTWNNKQNALTAGEGITIIDDVISASGSGGSDTGWQPIGLITSGQIGALQGAWAYEAPVDSAFAYRVINGNHVYLAGGFRVISAPPVDTVISAALPDSIRPRRLVPDGSGGLNWSIGNVRFNCATATSNVNVELAIEQGGNVIRWKGMSGDTKTDMVSVMFDYYVS